MHMLPLVRTVLLLLSTAGMCAMLMTGLCLLAFTSRKRRTEKFD